MIPQGASAWGREGHHIIVILAGHYMRPESAARMREMLAPESPEEASVWADEYRHDHRETGPWHYIDIPLADSKIDLARECGNGDCVIAKTEQFLAVLKDPNADKNAKAQALKFVIHFVGDMHQPLHDEDKGEKDGNMHHVIFDGHPDNLHWVWDTGLLQNRNRNTREAYGRAVGALLGWCEERGRTLETIDPVMVAAYVGQLLRTGWRSRP